MNGLSSISLINILMGEERGGCLNCDKVTFVQKRGPVRKPSLKQKGRCCGQDPAETET